MFNVRFLGAMALVLMPAAAYAGGSTPGQNGGTGLAFGLGLLGMLVVLCMTVVALRRPIFLAAMFLMAVAGAALAQAPNTQVNALGLYEIVAPYVFMLVSAVVVGLLTWITNLVKQWTGIQIQAKHREAIHSAAMTGVAAGLARARVKASEVTFDVKSVVIKEAVDWAYKSVPDALKALGVGPDKLAELAASKLTLLAEAPAGTAPAQPVATTGA
jgi:hypothetical protein